LYFRKGAAIAEYQDAKCVRSVVTDQFDELHHPGEPAPTSGIYRCIHCGHEALVGNDKTLPPRDHHSHRDKLWPVEWRLLVRPSYIAEAKF
jgi:hypothetical protein